VFIDGVPLYGDRIFMEHFWERPELEEIRLTRGYKNPCYSGSERSCSRHRDKVAGALEAEGISLAPLT
jgi:hypothetical protein